MLRGFLLCALLISSVSCSLGNSYAETVVHSAIDTERFRTVVLELPDDSWDLEGSIKSRLRGLGFEVVPEGSDRPPDLIVFADYQTYWDVVHQTFNYFDISFEDPKTGKALVTSKYVGRFGFNDCEAALDVVFRDLRDKLKQVN